MTDNEEVPMDEVWIVKAAIEGDYPVRYDFGPFVDEVAADAFRDDIAARSPIRGLEATPDVLTSPDAATHLLRLGARS